MLYKQHLSRLPGQSKTSNPRECTSSADKYEHKMNLATVASLVELFKIKKEGLTVTIIFSSHLPPPPYLACP